MSSCPYDDILALTELLHRKRLKESGLPELGNPDEELQNFLQCVKWKLNWRSSARSAAAGRAERGCKQKVAEEYLEDLKYWADVIGEAIRRLMSVAEEMKQQRW